jgi:hypothetical protein
VRIATERWADEEAAREIGDRPTVARAVARAALVGTDAPGSGLAMGDVGVIERVEALFDDAPRRHITAELGILGLACTATVALAVVVIQPALAVVFGDC